MANLRANTVHSVHVNCMHAHFLSLISWKLFLCCSSYEWPLTLTPAFWAASATWRLNRPSNWCRISTGQCLSDRNTHKCTSRFSEDSRLLLPYCFFNMCLCVLHVPGTMPVTVTTRRVTSLQVLTSSDPTPPHLSLSARPPRRRPFR